LFLGILSFLLLVPAPSFAQRELAGSAKTQIALERLGVTGSALLIAAHPDDENTALLAWLARGRKVRTGYLSITRGEGGQNLIGTEQGDAMGIIRTEELLAARRVDGAEQFFTRAIDFGFTKTPKEALDKWGHDKVLADVVWVIRKFRPDVIILRFSGTPRDGHGQHQASAMLGKEAFTAAGDPKRFPEQLKWVQPWQAKRIVWNAFAFSDEQRKEMEKSKDKIEADPGEYDPVLGYSFREIAGMSRTMHRSQGMGSSEIPGTSREYFTPVAGEPATKDLFDGVDLTWKRVEGGGPVGELVSKALGAFRPDRPENALAPLLEARRRFAMLHDPIVDRKLKDLDDAIGLCAGLWLDATADRFGLTQGSSVKVKTSLMNRGPLEMTSGGVSVTGLGPPKTAGTLGAPLKHNKAETADVELKVPTDTPVSQPYWLIAPKQGDSYTVADQTLIGQPENPPVAEAAFSVNIQGQTIKIVRPVNYRWVDRQRGQLTRPLAVVPPVALELAARALMFGSEASHEISVRVKSVLKDENGSVRLTAPEGWSVEPPSRDFHFPEAGLEAALEFRVAPPARDSQGTLRVVATVAGQEVSAETELIDYQHIPPQFLFPPAEARLVRADVRTMARSIGYVMGAGDEVPEALRQIGCTVTLLSAEDLAAGDLSRFDAIVTGVRAYNVRTDLRANQRRLMEYVERGGTLITQYNTLDAAIFGGDQHALDHLIGPYDVQIGSDRVTVEDAPVKFLDAASPLLHQPNAISGRDFEGWIQERGLYFAKTWDKRYKPLFSLNDPGEKPLEGATLYAPYGKGVFVFTAFSWFRELPAGVPGAFRIFANLLSAGKTAAPAQAQIR
jgi:LmbE family N-acetylglucosaminyl deacetylase